MIEGILMDREGRNLNYVFNVVLFSNKYSVFFLLVEKDIKTSEFLWL